MSSVVPESVVTCSAVEASTSGACAVAGLRTAAVMAANPGHYVAAVITTTAPQPAAGDGAAASSAAAAPVKHLKLLRPDDTLLLGRVYRLVSFEGTVPVRALRCLAVLGRPVILLRAHEVLARSCARIKMRFCVLFRLNAIVD